MPPRRASTKTVTRGRRTNTLKNTSVMPIRTARTQGASVVTRGGRAATKVAAGSVTSDMAEPLSAPSLQQVDGEEEDERDRQHHGRDHGRGGVVEFLQLHDDQKRGDLRDIGHVAGDEDDRPVLADGARKCQGEAGEEGGQE